jgi:hypothetical protein
VKAAKDSDVARLVVLTEANLENQQGNSNQKEGQEVGDEKGPSSVVSRERYEKKKEKKGKRALRTRACNMD